MPVGGVLPGFTSSISLLTPILFCDNILLSGWLKKASHVSLLWQYTLNGLPQSVQRCYAAAGERKWNMDKKIAYILAVAENNSISKAADKLYISQPSLSRYITKLEDELGVKLFQRSMDGIRLTEAGKVYVEYAQKMTCLQNKLEQDLEQIKRNVSEKDEISICMTINSIVLSPQQLTKAFHQKYPNCKLTIMNIMSRDIPDILVNQRCDIVIGPDMMDHQRYKLKPLSNGYLILAVPTKYNIEHLAEDRKDMPLKWVDIRKLPQMDFLLQDSSCNIRKGIDALLKSQSVAIRPQMELTNSILTIQAAEQQKSCFFCSEGFFTFITDRGQFRYYIVSEQMTHCYAIYDKNKVLSRQERYFLSLINHMFSKETQKQFDEFIDISHKDGR